MQKPCSQISEFFIALHKNSVSSVAQGNLEIYKAGADPGFFLGGGALVSGSTSTPINHIVFFLAEYQLY